MVDCHSGAERLSFSAIRVCQPGSASNPTDCSMERIGVTQLHDGLLASALMAPTPGCSASKASAFPMSIRMAPGAAGRFSAHYSAALRICVAGRAETLTRSATFNRTCAGFQAVRALKRSHHVPFLPLQRGVLPRLAPTEQTLHSARGAQRGPRPQAGPRQASQVSVSQLPGPPITLY